MKLIVYKIYTMSFIRKIKTKSGTYLAEVESQWKNGKVCQKHIRYVGKVENNRTVLSTSVSEISIDSVKMSGALPLLHDIAKSIDLPTILGDYSNELLSMVYAHCLDYKSLNNMPQWFERSDLNRLLNLEGLTQSKLLKALDSLNNQDLTELQLRIFDRSQEVYDFSTNGVLYDVTNTYVYGTKTQLAKLGYSKDGKRRCPLIQIGLAVTKEDGIPLIHKAFEGNMRDPQTFTSLNESLLQYGIKNPLVIYDRGIVSRKNLLLSRENNWHCITGLSLQGELKNKVIKCAKKSSILNFKNRVELPQSSYYVLSENYEHSGIAGKLLICLNNQLRIKTREARHDEISHAQKQLQQKNRIKEGLKKYFDSNNKPLLSKIQEAELFDGFSCLFCTNKALPKHEILQLYYEKDLIEKAFQTLKGVVNIQPIRHWLYNRVIAHIFICYLSYLLLSIMKYKLKKISMSPITAIEHLRNLYSIYIKDLNNNFLLTKCVTPNKSQVQIIKQINPLLLKDFP